MLFKVKLLTVKTKIWTNEWKTFDTTNQDSLSTLQTTERLNDWTIERLNDWTNDKTMKSAGHQTVKTVLRQIESVLVYQKPSGDLVHMFWTILVRNTLWLSAILCIVVAQMDIWRIKRNNAKKAKEKEKEREWRQDSTRQGGRTRLHGLFCVDRSSLG